MHDERGDGERVEHLVEAEPARCGVGPLEAVDDAAERVEQAGQDHREGSRSGRVKEVTEPEDRRPAQCDVDGQIEPAGGADPEHPERDPEQRPAPDQPQQHLRVAAVQQRDRERRIGARDQQEDVRVVEPSEHPFGLGDQFRRW